MPLGRVPPAGPLPGSVLTAVDPTGAVSLTVVWATPDGVAAQPGGGPPGPLTAFWTARGRLWAWPLVRRAAPTPDGLGWWRALAPPTAVERRTARRVAGSWPVRFGPPDAADPLPYSGTVVDLSVQGAAWTAAVLPPVGSVLACVLTLPSGVTARWLARVVRRTADRVGCAWLAVPAADRARIAALVAAHWEATGT